MSEPDDLFAIYNADRSAKRPLDGAALAAALADNLRGAFTTLERLAAEVTQALGQARYVVRLSPAVVDRSSYLRMDRASENFRDYARTWSQQRADAGAGGMHWEAQLVVTDHRRTSVEMGLAVAVEWPTAEAADCAFVEFWTTGQGFALPGDARPFQRALVAEIVRLEQAGTLRSAARRQTP
ncbi:hypothetical protein [Azospirillum sp. TSO22-1]|uniref:hypothetical protein n=1 Tax=Azospirillum sp. TSO22-1 TaxID=716789 RepID=UPI000D610C69|nr:hypothetical protein [Azospirillum sp. TSO22-1]PWC42582.1 hypothetical protein TSO221_21455 [Azospirillum sp. TSO22-1]